MNTSERDQVTPERLLQVGFAYAPPLIIAAAVRNKIFDSLVNGAKSAEQISKETGVAIAEWLVNDERTEPLPSLLFSVQMLVNSEQGDTFSFNEIKSWLGEAGFKKMSTLDAPGPSPLVLATKP